MAIGRKMKSAQGLKKASQRSAASLLVSIPKEEDGDLIVRMLEEVGDWYGYTRYYDEGSGYVPMMEDERAPSSARTQFRFACNALRVDDDAVIVLDLPKSLGSTFAKYAERYGTVMDRDYVLSRSGSGMNDTTYMAAPDDKGPRKLSKYKLTDVGELLEKIHDAALGADGTDDEEDDAPKGKSKTSTRTRKPKEPDLDALGESADEEDEDAQSTLTELAEAAELDPDDFDTWAELATAIAEAGEAGDEGEDDEATPPTWAEVQKMSLAQLKEFAERNELDIEGVKGKAAVLALIEEEIDFGDGEDEGEEGDEEVDLDALAEQADDDEDEDAIAALTAAAEEADLDPNDYDTWAELATAIGEAGGEDEGEDEDEVLDEDALKAMNEAQLRKTAKEVGVTAPKVFNKAKLIAMIMDTAED